MTETDKARIQELAHELDALVPRTDAIVLMNQYGGGCDKSQITATETGYLQMGIDLLKAPLLMGIEADKSAVSLDVDWEYLIAERSDIGFHMFHVDNTLEPDATYVPKPHQTWKDKAAGPACVLACLRPGLPASWPACVLACLLLGYVFGVGSVTIIQWMFR